MLCLRTATLVWPQRILYTGSSPRQIQTQPLLLISNRSNWKREEIPCRQSFHLKCKKEMLTLFGCLGLWDWDYLLFAPMCHMYIHPSVRPTVHPSICPSIHPLLWVHRLLSFRNTDSVDTIMWTLLLHACVCCVFCVQGCVLYPGLCVFGVCSKKKE